MIKVSDWYTHLSIYTFPTIFIPIGGEERKMLISHKYDDVLIKKLKNHIQRASQSIFGRYSIKFDYFNIPDLPRYSFGDATKALKYISKKPLLKNENVEKLLLQPFRRMSTEREFRLFVFNKKLVGMSQLYLHRYYKSLEKNKQFFLDKAFEFFEQIQNFLPYQNCCLDVYFTSQKKGIILNINEWEERNALLFTDWVEVDWKKEQGIRILHSPKEIKGDVTVDC